jgi:hypothetical protein
LPSVMGSIGWSKRGHARALPRSINLRYNPVAAQPCVALCAKRRQVCCPDEAAGFAVRSFAGAQADHIRSAGRGDRQHNSERKQGRQNAASSPSHVNPLDFEADICGDRLRTGLLSAASRSGKNGRGTSPLARWAAEGRRRLISAAARLSLAAMSGASFIARC